MKSLVVWSSNRNMHHSEIPISKLVSFSVPAPPFPLWHGFAVVAARLVVGQWESGSLAGQCALVVYGGVLDGVRADRRGIEPDFSMGRNRPSASWRGRRRGHVGNVGEGQPIWAKRGQGGGWRGGHMWRVCTSRTSVGEAVQRGCGGGGGGSCEHWRKLSLGGECEVETASGQGMNARNCGERKDED